MSDQHVRFAGSPITHLVAWSDDAGGYVNCAVLFSWRLNDPRLSGRIVAEAVEDNCDCMTCLVRNHIRVNFVPMYEDVFPSRGVKR